MRPKGLSQGVRVECSRDFYQAIMAEIAGRLVGKPVFGSDTLKSAIDKHCPDIFGKVSEAGFVLIPDDHVHPIVKDGYGVFYFDIVKLKKAKLH